PLARARAGFGSKNDLIEKIKGMATDELWLPRINKDRSWSSISNAKLLRLHAILTDAKQRFGSRDKLIEAIVAAEGRAKDTDYRKHFAPWPLPRLMDALRSAEHRNKLRAAKAAHGAAKPAGEAKTAEATAGAKKPAAGAKKGAAATKAG